MRVLATHVYVHVCASLFIGIYCAYVGFQNFKVFIGLLEQFYLQNCWILYCSAFFNFCETSVQRSVYFYSNEKCFNNMICCDM
jgi:hypothetical protein